MKRFFTILFVLILVFSVSLLALSLLFSYLFAPQDPILNSLPDYTTKEFYTCGGFQDTTDYAKYTYDVSESVFTHSSYFLKVTEENIPKISTYLDNFENWTRTCSDFPLESYDFDRSQIQEGDYFYILNRYEDPSAEFDSYNIYYFDRDARILYYFHNNI